MKSRKGGRGKKNLANKKTLPIIHGTPEYEKKNNYKRETLRFPFFFFFYLFGRPPPLSVSFSFHTDACALRNKNVKRSGKEIKQRRGGGDLKRWRSSSIESSSSSSSSCLEFTSWTLDWFAAVIVGPLSSSFSLSLPLSFRSGLSSSFPFFILSFISSSFVRRRFHELGCVADRPLVGWEQNGLPCFGPDAAQRPRPRERAGFKWKSSHRSSGSRPNRYRTIRGDRWPRNREATAIFQLLPSTSVPVLGLVLQSEDENQFPRFSSTKRWVK